MSKTAKQKEYQDCRSCKHMSNLRKDKGGYMSIDCKVNDITLSGMWIKFGWCSNYIPRFQENKISLLDI